MTWTVAFSHGTISPFIHMYLLFFIVFTRSAFDFSDCRNSNPVAQVSLSKILGAIPLNHDVDQR